MLAGVVVGFFFSPPQFFFQKQFFFIISIYSHLLQKNNQNADTMAC